MKKQCKPYHVTAILFALSLAVLFAFQMLKPDTDISHAERRPLKEKPELLMEEVMDGEYFEDYEAYLLDQAIFREAFRSIKALSSRYLLLKKDNNGLYQYRSGLYEIEHMNRESFESAGDKIESLSQKLNALNCYYAMIPDKNTLIAPQSKRPAIDMKAAETILRSTIRSASFIDIASLLSHEDYYHSDLHWKQENLLPIADAILQGMNNNAVQYSYTETFLKGFRGVYAGQSALPLEDETMCYLVNASFQNVTVKDLTSNTVIPLYDEDAFGSIDPYNLFLGGPRSLLRIENPNVTNGKTLYLFRDSFGSSLSPLLLCGYSEIILIDLRYIDSRALDAFVTFREGQDVLFLYSTHILNNSAMLR